LDGKGLPEVAGKKITYVMKPRSSVSEVLFTMGRVNDTNEKELLTQSGPSINVVVNPSA
jgi:hypothetical protein